MSTQRTPHPNHDRTPPAADRNEENRTPDARTDTSLDDIEAGDAGEPDRTDDDRTGLGRSDAYDDEASENR